MWRTEGAGELYTYLPPSFSANKAVCDVPPFSTCNDVYGASVARGSFDWATGQWTTISQRVRLNDVGEQNGELELFVGGKSVLNVDGLVLRSSDAGRIFGIQMQTFFGGMFSQAVEHSDLDMHLIVSFVQVPTALGPLHRTRISSFPTSRSLLPTRYKRKQEQSVMNLTTSFMRLHPHPHLPLKYRNFDTIIHRLKTTKAPFITQAHRQRAIHTLPTHYQHILPVHLIFKICRFAYLSSVS